VRVRIVAVGTRMPGWVTQAYEDYIRRLRPQFRVDLVELAIGKNKNDEGKRLLEKVRDDYLVALDEHGKSLTTLAVAKVARRAPTGWPGPVFRHRRTGRARSGNPRSCRLALVIVGTHVPACHGAGDIGRAAVSRGVGIAKSPVSSRVKGCD
jgi:hypothetical protein